MEGHCQIFFLLAGDVRSVGWPVPCELPGWHGVQGPPLAKQASPAGGGCFHAVKPQGTACAHVVHVFWQLGEVG